MRLVWLAEARDDIQRRYDFLLAKDPRAAERAVRGSSQVPDDYANSLKSVIAWMMKQRAVNSSFRSESGPMSCVTD